ncbi:hypothetical protein MOQ72_15645 [Saccharopolyspora sp. K220]|uniref:hypothetical protein n=1 Tax=Saccharopolyspora soli TaxID=2926618 RepID=UPI001F5AFA71|nr:hypothetical protein [Saccharopolyspora soli]MCI2418876.1 hypothetical protein [Saccharopolyspora soli]
MNSNSEYRSYGWWVEQDPKTDRTTLIIGGRVGALRIPAELAARVHHVLVVHLQAGPALADGDDWVLLTQPDGRGDLPDELAEVVAMPTGSRLALPPLDDPRWISPPRADRLAPPWQVVVSAARRAHAEILHPTA